MLHDEWKIRVRVPAMAEVTESQPEGMTATNGSMELPSKQDRLLLYHELERIVHSRIRSLRYLPDTRPTNWRGRVLKDEYPEASTVGLRGRQIDHMRMELLPIVSASLLLPLADLHDATTTASSTTSVPKHDNSSPNDDTIGESTTSTTVASGTSSTTTHSTTATTSTIPIHDPIGCISLLLSNILLLSKGNYDARIRNVVKTACVSILQDTYRDEPLPEVSPARCLYSITKEHAKAAADATTAGITAQPPSKRGDNNNNDDDDEEELLFNSAITLPLTPTQIAKERFETLEKTIAADILHVLIANELQLQQQQAAADAASKNPPPTTSSTTKKQVIIRSLQISSVTLVVGGLFAVTGGLAAPVLASALSALCVATHTAGAIAVTLTSTAALTSMFGVVGGGLTAYKMKRRTDGLSEWRIRKETGIHNNSSTKDEQVDRQQQDQQSAGAPNTNITVRGLHATVCVSGWLRSKQDFQTPFGVHADDPPSDDWLELLQRFFAVHAPDKIRFAKILLKSNKGNEADLWERLKEKYGIDPNHLLPFEKKPEQLFPVEMTTETIPSFVAANLKDHAKEMEQIYESNTMLQQMERMNAEMFAQMNLETLEAMQESASSSCHSPNRNVNLTDSTTSAKSEEDCLDSNGETGKEVSATPDPTLSMRSETKSSCDEVEFSTANTNAIASGPSSEFSNENDQRGNALAEVSDDCEANVVLGQKDGKTDPTADPTADGTDKDQNGLERERMDSIDGEQNESAVDGMLAEDSERDSESDSTDPNSKSAKAATQQKTLMVWDWEANYSGEMYTITWETAFLLKLCKVMEVLVLEVSGQLSKEVLKRAVLHGSLGAAIALPSALTTATGVIDDPYQLISFRSDKAGLELARCLLESDEHRPVSLVGYSFGARVIFSCLLELIRHQAVWEEQQRPTKAKDAVFPDEEEEEEEETTGSAKKKTSWIARRRRMRQKKQEASVVYKREPASIVEDVVLIGMPMLLVAKEWISVRELVGGRVINCHNKSDWILSYMINIRCWNGVSKTCGVHGIPDIEGVENYEVSHLAPTHGQYPLAVPHILHEIGYGEPCHKVGSTVEIVK
jgi:hypothetical protein